MRRVQAHHVSHGQVAVPGNEGPTDEEENSLNNNRNNNRRRGRGNRNQGGANSANRIDSRARGNAPQLLDKYKKLAQDAQHNGDRVQMEYYLQFADHYFRVLADNKARQDEQRAKRDSERGNNRDDDDDDDDDGDDNRNNRRNTRSRREDSDNRSDGRGDDRGDDRRNRKKKHRDHDDDQERAGNDDDGEEERPKRKARKPRKSDEGERGVEGEIDASVLPPSISADEDSETAVEVVEKKPRRRRKPDGDNETLSAVG